MSTMIALVALDIDQSKAVASSVRLLVGSASKVGLDADIAIISNSKDNLFSGGLHRLSEFKCDYSCDMEALMAAAAQRLRPRLLADLPVHGYDRVVLLDADCIFARAIDFNCFAKDCIFSSRTRFVQKGAKLKFAHEVYSPSLAVVPGEIFSILMRRWWSQLLVCDESGVLRPDIVSWNTVLEEWPKTQAIPHGVFATNDSPCASFLESPMIHFGACPVEAGERFRPPAVWSAGKARLQEGFFLSRFYASITREIARNVS